jgi:hypothetical protein
MLTRRLVIQPVFRDTVFPEHMRLFGLHHVRKAVV